MEKLKRIQTKRHEIEDARSIDDERWQALLVMLKGEPKEVVEKNLRLIIEGSILVYYKEQAWNELVNQQPSEQVLMDLFEQKIFISKIIPLLWDLKKKKQLSWSAEEIFLKSYQK